MQLDCKKTIYLLCVLDCYFLTDLMLIFDFFLFLSGDSGVWGLKKNFALLELLERLQNGATNQSGVAEEALKGMGEVRTAPPLQVSPSS